MSLSIYMRTLLYADEGGKFLKGCTLKAALV
jgi:hypothetical protein